MKNSWEERTVDEIIAEEKRLIENRKNDIFLRRLDLQDRGYEMCEKPCPECGCLLWERYSEVRVGSDEWETIGALDHACPCCGYEEDTSYDA